MILNGLYKVCRRRSLGSECIMEDASGEIQETGHEQRLARMVGLFSLDSARTSRDADLGYLVRLLRQWGKR